MAAVVVAVAPFVPLLLLLADSVACSYSTFVIAAAVLLLFVLYCCSLQFAASRSTVSKLQGGGKHQQVTMRR